MYTKSWMVIRDDAKKTFEVCGLTDNTNHFENSVHGMQKAGMNVSCMILPVTTKTASKETIKVVGYRAEQGLHARIMKAYAEKTRHDFEQWEE
jgi:hypothetical protein